MFVRTQWTQLLNGAAIKPSAYKGRPLNLCFMVLFVLHEKVVGELDFFDGKNFLNVWRRFKGWSFFPIWSVGWQAGQQFYLWFTARFSKRTWDTTSKKNQELYPPKVIEKVALRAATLYCPFLLHISHPSWLQSCINIMPACASRNFLVGLS